VTVTPDNKQYDASLGSCTVTPTQTGQAQYTLVANGPGGEVSSLPVTVDVYNPSDAQILAFDASPKEVEEGNPTPVTLSWTVTKAVRVTLTGPGITTPTDGVGLTGSMQVAITDKSVFVLTATDEDNRATSKRVVVFFKRLAPPVPPPTDQTTTGTINPAPTTGTPTTGTQTTGAATTGTATTGTGVIH
jgi:hypothetical protein